MRPRRALPLRVLLGLIAAGAVVACSIDIAGTGDTAPGNGDSGPNGNDATMPTMTDDAMPAGDDDAPSATDAPDDVTEPTPDADMADAAPDANETSTPDTGTGDAGDASPGSDAGDGGCDGSTCNRAASFTSINQFIHAMNVPSMDQFTMEAFVKPTSLSTSTNLLAANGIFCADKGGNAKDFYAGLYKNNSSATVGVFGINIGNGQGGTSDVIYDTSPSALPTGQWTFVAIGHNAGSSMVHLFIGGTEYSKSVDYGGPYSDIQSFNIGGSGTGDAFAGLIDEVRVYSDYRGGTAIATAATADATKKSNPDTTNLIMYWKFNDATGSATVSDSSGQNNPGTLTGGVTLVASDLQ